MTPTSVHEVKCLDAVEYLKSLPDASVDLLITDPSYESLEKHRKIGTTTRLKNRWFEIFPNSRYNELFVEVHRVLKKNSHFYMMCDQETMFVTKPLGEEAGFKFWKGIVWNKKKIGMGYHYRAQHEMILFFEKGKRKLNNLGIGDVLSVDRIRTDYPTEKPVELYKILIEQSSDEGDVVCDPFCGSGSGAEAAVKLKRYFWGNDKSDSAVRRTKKRIHSATTEVEQP
jgi:site-specific DNA-methyltransferase (adenine-specific)